MRPFGKRLSLIIVNWNTNSLLQQCLSSITANLRSSCGLYEIGSDYVLDIWVVDNASSDGSPQMVADRFPDVNLLRNDENLGFACANNQGISVSQSQYVLLLNSDTIVPPGALSGLLRFMDEYPTAGVCGPQLLQADETPQPYAFGNDPTLPYLFRRGMTRMVWHRYLHDWATNEVQEVDWISGACMLLRRAVLDQVGLMDESFFMYFEDNDLCLRIRQAGWQVYYNPAVAIVHLGGQSLKQNPRAQRAYQNSLRYFYAKHYHPLAQWALGLGLWVYNHLVRATEMPDKGQK